MLLTKNIINNIDILAASVTSHLPQKDDDQGGIYCKEPHERAHDYAGPVDRVEPYAVGWLRSERARGARALRLHGVEEFIVGCRVGPFATRKAVIGYFCGCDRSEWYGWFY